MDNQKRIDDLTARQKELILQNHNFSEQIDAAEFAREQKRRNEKEIAWIAGALEALKLWPEDEDAEPEKATSVGAN